MRRTKVRRALVLLSPLVLMFLTVELAATIEPLCVTAYRWVVNHRDSLPKDTQDFLSFPAVYRAYIFNESNAEQKARFYKEGLATIRSEWQLSDDANQRLTELIASINPHLYTNLDQEVSNRVDALADKVQILLPRNKRAHLSPVLRTNHETFSHRMRHPTVWLMDTRRRYADYILAATTTAAADCNCKYDSHCCNPGGGGQCSNQTPCEAAYGPCGGGGQVQCTGRCVSCSA